jgi:integrase
MSDSAAFRLVGEFDQPSPHWTPEEFFDRYVWPLIFEPEGRKPRTRDEYRQTLRYATRFTHAAGLDQFQRVEVVANWHRGLRSLRKDDGEPLAANTLRKHCTHLQCVLDRAGPKKRERRHSRNAGLLADVPLIEKPAATRGRTKNVYSLEGVGMFQAASFAAKSPRLSGLLASTWWRSLVIVIYNCGLRIGTATQLQRAWLEVDRHGTWFNIPPEAMKMKQPIRVYVNRWARAAIDAIPIDRNLIFEWPHTMQYLDACRVKILKRSGLPEAEQFGFNGIRKRANSEIQMINTAAARLFAGHATGDVNLTYYTDPDVLVQACERLPQPPVPEVAPPPADDPQLWMF